MNAGLPQLTDLLQAFEAAPAVWAPVIEEKDELTTRTLRWRQEGKRAERTTAACLHVHGREEGTREINDDGLAYLWQAYYG